VTYLSQNTLHWWANLAIAIYVLMVAIFLVGPIIWRGLKYWKVTRGRARLERTFLPKLLEVVNQFRPVIESGRGDTLWGVWQNAGATAEMQKHVRPAHSHFGVIRNWYDHLCHTIQLASPEDFRRIATEAASWVQQYSSLGRDAYPQFENLLRDEKIDAWRVREIKQNWNHIRDEHNRLISNWLDLCEQVNTSFGENICSIYCEKLRPLE